MEYTNFIGHFLKVYPNHSKLFIYDYPIKVPTKGAEIKNKPKNKKLSIIEQYVSKEDSIRRTKTNISDIILCTNFELFVTFTFKEDRQDILKTKKKMSLWLKQQQQIHGKFEYILVPEFHKDGKAIHFHGLLRGYKGQLKDSKKVQNGRTIYNIESYKKGFTTAVEIDNSDKVANYVKKYITKDMPLLPGKKRYWVSTGIKRPDVYLNPNLDFLLSYFTEVYAKSGLTIYEQTNTMRTQLNKG
jgi:hypothetical protein